MRSIVRFVEFFNSVRYNKYIQWFSRRNDMEKCVMSENGVPVYYDANPNLHSVELGLYIRCGSMYENAVQNGITHFFEHIVFRNINKIMGGKMYAGLDRRAVEFNAGTYKEFLYFDFFFSPAETDFIIEVFEKIFAELVLTPQDVDTERNVIKAEIYEEANEETLSYAADCEVWKGTSLTRTILGTDASVDKITLKELLEFRKWLFASGDMFVYLTGNVNDETVNKTVQALSRAKITVAEKSRLNIAGIPKKFAKRDCTVTVTDGVGTRVQLCFDCYKTETSSPEIDLLTDYIFKGESCPFYYEIRERLGFIYSHDVTVEDYANACNIKIAFDVKRKNIIPVLKETVRILNAVKTGENDLTAVKNIYKRKIERQLDDVAALNWRSAYNGHICDSRPCLPEDYDERYLKTDSARVSQIAKTLFTTDRLTVAVKHKKPSKIDKAKIKEIMRGLDE